MKVAILLCTFNGDRHLDQQLDSFAAQTHTDWCTWASDDGSHDNTVSILKNYQAKWAANRLFIQRGPASGFVANFLSLTFDTSIVADCYAYSDQDDIWNDNKLARAVSWLQTVSSDIPALYCSRAQLVDANNNNIGLSPLFAKTPSFSNALIQNICSGNTMVFNHAARDLLMAAGRNKDIVTHDWWAYMVVAGCGGTVFYDSRPSLHYRQHECNLIGMKPTWSARWSRLRMRCNGRSKQWNDKNIQSLQRIRTLLTSDNNRVLSYFIEARTLGLYSRLIAMKRSGVHRQNILENLGLFIEIALKRA